MIRDISVWYPICGGCAPAEYLQPTVFVVHPAVSVHPEQMQQRGITDMATWPKAIEATDAPDMSVAEMVTEAAPVGRYLQSRPVIEKPYVILARTRAQARVWATAWGLPMLGWNYHGSPLECEGLSNVKVLIAPGFEKRGDAREIRKIIEVCVKTAGVEIIEPLTLPKGDTSDVGG